MSIRLDKGPEFIADVFEKWAQSKGTALNHIQPGKTTQNAYAEGFNKAYRAEVLDSYVFNNLQEVCDMTVDWLHRCNLHRPHEALGRTPPGRVPCQTVLQPLHLTGSANRGDFTIRRH